MRSVFRSLSAVGSSAAGLFGGVGTTNLTQQGFAATGGATTTNINLNNNNGSRRSLLNFVVYEECTVHILNLMRVLLNTSVSSHGMLIGSRGCGRKSVIHMVSKVLSRQTGSIRLHCAAKTQWKEELKRWLVKAQTRPVLLTVNLQLEREINVFVGHATPSLATPNLTEI